MATTNTWEEVVTKISGVANRGAFSKTFTPTTSSQSASGASGYYSSVSTTCNAVSLTGNAGTAQVLTGYTFYNNSLTRQTGTMANRGNLNWSPSSSTSYSVSAGYYSGGTLNSSGAYNAGVTAADNRVNTKIQSFEDTKSTIVASNLGKALGMATTNTWEEVVSKISGVANNGAFSKTFTPTTSAQSASGAAGYYSSVSTICNAVSLSGNAGVAQVLTGYTFYNTSLTRQTGTMANRGALNWNPSSSTTYSVSAGYYSGGTLNSSGAYNAGVTAADNRANANSTNYKTGYNAGYSAGQSAKRDSISLTHIGPPSSDVTVNNYTFSASSGRCYVAAMGGDPGQFQNFYITGGTLISNISAGDTPPSGSQFVRMISFKATSSSVTIKWTGDTGSTAAFTIVGLVG